MIADDWQSFMKRYKSWRTKGCKVRLVSSRTCTWAAWDVSPPPAANWTSATLTAALDAASAVLRHGDGSTCIMGRRPRGGGGLGRAIAKDRNRTKKTKTTSVMHTTELEHGIASVTDQKDLNEVMELATLAGKDFTARRGEARVMDATSGSVYERKGGVSAHASVLHVQKHAESEAEAAGDEHDELAVAPPSTLQTLKKVSREDLVQTLAKSLRVPRRPQWDESTTPEQLEEAERTMFLAWRRSLSEVEHLQDVVLTPFEKNLEVWRQLWRVIERSDIVVQVIDVRNPLLFRCSDLERYVAEVDPRKKCVLVLNKSDLLPASFRLRWREFFRRLNVIVVFWSAHAERTRQEEGWAAKKAGDEAATRAAAEAAEQSRTGGSDYADTTKMSGDVATGSTSDGGGDSEGEESVKGGETEDEEEAEDEKQQGDQVDGVDERKVGVDATAEGTGEGDEAPVETDPTGQDTNSVSVSVAAPVGREGPHRKKRVGTKYPGIDPTRVKYRLRHARDESGAITTPANWDPCAVLTRDELLQFFRDLCVSPLNPEHADGRITIGFVGYPNVGKSSTINVLCEAKKVAVSATPGKTKHFQTLLVGDAVRLCDCPGLVFPSFTSSRGELVINGVLPISSCRDFIQPVRLICQRLPRALLRTTYGLELGEITTRTQLLLRHDGRKQVKHVVLPTKEFADASTALREMEAHDAKILADASTRNGHGGDGADGHDGHDVGPTTRGQRAASKKKQKMDKRGPKVVETLKRSAYVEYQTDATGTSGICGKRVHRSRRAPQAAVMDTLDDVKEREYHPDELLPAQLLDEYAVQRGFFGNHGRPDSTQAARVIVADYINGKLLYADLPPNDEHGQ